MTAAPDIWAVLPVKETVQAKQRLARVLSQEQRRQLALAMLEDVLRALSQAAGLAGILMVTVDPAARAMAERFGARVLGQNAQAGHTEAVAGAARLLAAEGRGGMLALPGDVPLVEAADIELLLSRHGPAPAFTIAAAHDDLGSNAVLCSPPDAVPLRFGDDSFYPHLDAARQSGIDPVVLRLPRLGLDIDGPEDLARFLALPSAGATRAVLEGFGLAPQREAANREG